MICDWLNRWVQKHGHRGRIIKLYSVFQLCGRSEPPNLHAVQESTVYKMLVIQIVCCYFL